MKSTYATSYSAFLSQLRALRSDCDVSQVILAQRLSKPQSYVSKVEQGQRRLDLVELVEWLEALDLPIESTLLKLGGSLVQPHLATARRRLKVP